MDETAVRSACARHYKIAKCRTPQETKNSPGSGVFSAYIMTFMGRARRASSYNWRVEMGNVKKPRTESDEATLARVKKEMEQPRIAKSARKDA
jgi:hypothetical protein